MDNETAIIGFIGAGGIARSHAYSLNSMKFFYNDAPRIIFDTVCSARPETRSAFAESYGFREHYDLRQFSENSAVNTVFILSPNQVHFEHLKIAMTMPSVTRIYLEKPVCSGREEEKSMSELVAANPHIKIQVGFQFLFSSTIREMIGFWKKGSAGAPVHFDLKYYHGDYLRKEYRHRRQSRLTPAPDGGAMADLGSHSISLLIALLGGELEVVSAIQGGNFSDVIKESDLFSQISVFDKASGATGSISASRISSGSGDTFTVELFATKGSIRYSSSTPDFFEHYSEETGLWSRVVVGSNFKPVTSFPSAHVPPGWLRSMIHAHYVFLTAKTEGEFIPDIRHGLQVQKILNQTAEKLEVFRKTHSKG